MLGRVTQREQQKRRYRALRAAVGLSQIDVATLAGMSHNRFWRIENGYDAPTPDEAGALAKVLHVQELSEALAS